MTKSLNSVLCLLAMLLPAGSLPQHVHAADERMKMVGEQGLLLPVSELKPKTADGARAEFGTSPIKRAGNAGLSVQKTNAAGFVTIDTPLVKIEPGVQYKISYFLQATQSNYAAFANLVVREYESATQKALMPYHSTHPEFRVLLPGRQGEWIPRYSTFTAGAKSQYAGASLVFTGNPVSVIIGEVRIEKAGNEKVAPAPRQQDVLSDIETANRELLKRPNSSARVVSDGRNVKLLIDGQERNPVWYQRTYWDDKDSLHGLFSEANVPIQLVQIKLGPYESDADGIRPALWTGHKTYNFAAADAALERALRVNPNLYIVVGFTVNPYPEWGDRYPDEVIQNEMGIRGVGSYVHNTAFRNERLDKKTEFWCPSLYSEVYKREVVEAMAAWFNHIKDKPAYRAVIGFGLFGGDDGQWGNWARSGILNMGDYSPAGKKAFQRWLRARYGTPAALAAAWNRPGVNFENAEIPSVERRRSLEKPFLDPRQEKDVIDYTQFESEGKNNTIVYLAEAIKRLAGKDVICGSYYEDAIYGRMSNHWAEKIRQRSSALDFFATPLDYGPYRRAGWAGGIGATTASLRLHNKLFLTELDLRTGVSRKISDEYDYFTIGRLETPEQFNAVNRRETGTAIAQGMGQWYYAMAGGSFYAPYAKAGIRESTQIFEWAQRHREQNFTPEVAVFADEDSAPYVSKGVFNQVVFPSTSTTRSALYLSGVPFDMYGTQDLMNAKLPDYKVYVFLNSYYLTREQRAFTEDKLKKNGKTLVWMHAAGYIDESGLSTENMAKLTGLTVKLDTKSQDLNVTTTANALLGFQNLQPWQGAAHAAVTGPKFWCDDERATTIGQYIRGGESAIAVRKFPEWTSVYIAKPGGLGPDMLNAIARDAGAYTITDSGNMAVTNGNLLMLHGALGGQRTVTLPFAADVTDLLTQKTIAKNARTLTIDIPTQETQLWGLQKTGG